MKVLLFKDMFIQSICEGEKTVTRRKRRKDIVKGDRILAKTSHYGKAFALLEAVDFERFEPLSDIRAHENDYEAEGMFAAGLADRTMTGFQLWDTFISLWDAINHEPRFQSAADPRISVIRFKLIEDRREHYHSDNTRN